MNNIPRPSHADYTYQKKYGGIEHQVVEEDLVLEKPLGEWLQELLLKNGLKSFAVLKLFHG